MILMGIVPNIQLLFYYFYKKIITLKIKHANNKELI